MEHKCTRVGGSTDLARTVEDSTVAQPAGVVETSNTDWVVDNSYDADGCLDTRGTGRAVRQPLWLQSKPKLQKVFSFVYPLCMHNNIFR